VGSRLSGETEVAELALCVDVVAAAQPALRAKGFDHASPR
jgi:hypothetical protein